MGISPFQIALRSMMQFTPRPAEDPLAGLTKAVIIGMAFSANNKNDLNRVPGRSNEDIARTIATLWTDAIRRRIEVHVLVQREVAEALEKDRTAVPVACVLREEGEEKHISSHKILGQAWAYAKAEGITDAIIVAHKRHVLRAAWNAQIWGFTVRLPRDFTRHYAPESTQWHTRNAFIYNLVWEPLARVKLFLDSLKF